MTVFMHATPYVSVCIYELLCEETTSTSLARLSRKRLIERGCPALWTMSPFQISRRPIENNYNLGDTEEHYSVKPSWPLKPTVFPLQFETFNFLVVLTQETVNDRHRSPTKKINSVIFLCLKKGNKTLQRKRGTAPKIF